MRFDKNMLLLYAVTDRSWVGQQSFYEQIEDAILGGATMVQLREKGMSDEELIKEAIQVKNICHRYNVPLIINDNPLVALKSGADGVHVGIDDESVSEIRCKAGADFIIGATAKTIEQAVMAEQAGADYLGIGAVFPSPTKKNAIRISYEQLKAICSSVSIPTVAIGGISFENISEIKGAGVDGVAVVSAVFAADNIRRETAELKRRASKYIS